MANRIKQSFKAILIAIDILLCTLWLAPLYVFNLASRPSGRQMISSYVGQAAHYGYRWAKPVEAVIDWAAVKLGDKDRHCYRAFRHYERLDD